MRSDGLPGPGEPSLTDAVECHVKPARQGLPVVSPLTVQMSCSQRPNQVGVSRPRGTPHLATRQLAEHDERLADSTGRADDQ